jgi:hypothetical protein
MWRACVDVETGRATARPVFVGLQGQEERSGHRQGGAPRSAPSEVAAGGQRGYEV